MTLPYDYARCAGTTHPTCQWCRRREPGREHWQSYIAPPIDTLTGECGSFIEPLRTYVSNNTTPNAIGQGSAACGASPAPTGCASNGTNEERTDK